MTMDEIEGLFRDEARELLDDMEQALLELESGSAASGVVDRLFRDAHSLKGGAGMLGLDPAYELAHALEELLGDAREHGRVPPALVEPMLRATDSLWKAVTGELTSTAAAVGELERARHAAGNGSPDNGSPDNGSADPRPQPPATAPEPERRSLRVDATRVDRVLDAVGETILHHRQLERRLTAADAGARELLDRSDLLLDELQHSAVQLRLMPIASIAAAFPRGVRDLAAAEGKQIEFSFTGGETRLDRALLDGASDAISHLLRNAVAHGIEQPDERERAGKPPAGRVWLRAEQRGEQAVIEVEDDGRGVGRDLLDLSESRDVSLAELLSEPGLSTAEQVTGLAGRGVGLDAVRAHLEAVGGQLEVESSPGHGTKATLVLPVSIAMVRVMLVERGPTTFGIPLSGIVEVLRVDGAQSLGGHSWLTFDGTPVQVADLTTALGGPASEPPASATAIVVGARPPVALVCDRVLGEDEMIVKPLGPMLAHVRGYLGGALMTDGRIALIVDPGFLVARAHRVAPAAASTPEPAPVAPTVLVVDDQFTVRELQRSILEAAGYSVQAARDGREAWDLLHGNPRAELVVTDIEMPAMGGLELLAEIRADAQLASTPVVIVSSRGTEQDELSGLEAGADAYIVKERFDQQALLDTVARLVGR